MVDDQEKALTFYTKVMGFLKKKDIPLGKFRWLTVASPEGPDDIGLLLEPNEFPATRTYQKSLFEAGLPLTSFAVGDIQYEYQRMKDLGVTFTMEPTHAGTTTVAVLNDTCGNLIQIYQD